MQDIRAMRLSPRSIVVVVLLTLCVAPVAAQEEDASFGKEFDPYLAAHTLSVAAELSLRINEALCDRQFYELEMVSSRSCSFLWSCMVYVCAAQQIAMCLIACRDLGMP